MTGEMVLSESVEPMIARSKEILKSFVAYCGCTCCRCVKSIAEERLGERKCRIDRL